MSVTFHRPAAASYLCHVCHQQLAATEFHLDGCNMPSSGKCKSCVREYGMGRRTEARLSLVRERTLAERVRRKTKAPVSVRGADMCAWAAAGWTEEQLAVLDTYMGFAEAFIAVFNERVIPGMSPDAIDGFHAAVAARARRQCAGVR